LVIQGPIANIRARTPRRAPTQKLSARLTDVTACKSAARRPSSAKANDGGRGMIDELLPQAERIAAKLKARNETISIAESSTAGLVSAALLAIGGASAYFMGGAVVYTRASRSELLRVTEAELAALTGITPSTEPYALLFARKIKERLGTTWGLGETGTAGPTGSRYGHAPGHSCIAVIGPNGERAITVETGQADRLDNMRAFSVAALDLLEKSLG
jgi:nicotinamide-nucleotide amidase